MIIQNYFSLVNISLVDGNGGELKKNTAIVVKNGLISSVAGMESYRRPDGAQEIDLDGYYVMPGLIDAHVHLSGGRGDAEYQEIGVMAEPKLLRAMRSVYEAQELLKRGFTSCRDISWNGLYLKRLFFEQIIPGPKVIACGPGLSRTGGHVDLYQYTVDYNNENGFWGILADGKEEIIKAVRLVLREGADQVKIWASGGDNWPHDRNTDVHYSLEELCACVEEAHRQKGTLVASHAENLEAIKMSVEAGADTIEHGEDLNEEVAEKMRDKGVILVPTLELIVNWYKDFIPTGDESFKKARPDAFLYRDLYGKDQDMIGEQYCRQAKDSFRLALEKDVKIALGSDTVYEPLTKYGEYSAREFKALVDCGMTVNQAITAATKTAAEALGMGHAIGTVEAGKAADLLVVKKDPTAAADVLYDPSNIFMTFCDGKLTVEDGRFAY